jgi:F420-dependent oxidoreductase-like protein
MPADEVVLPSPCLVVLVGISGSGKSTWAAAHFAPAQVVSSDALRGTVGAGEDDITASEDAFAVLEEIVARRVTRKLTTVVDTLGLDPARRAHWLTLARTRALSTACIAFAVPLTEARERLRARHKSVPQRVLSGQAKQFKEQQALIATEDFDVVLTPTAVRTAPAAIARASAQSRSVPAAPTALQFGLQIPAFDFPGGRAELRPTLAALARTAEDAGFASVWVMDHFRQIPMFGPAWHDMLDSYTALAYLAGVTDRVRLGALVTGVTLRSIPQLGKIIATLDVLSGGRAVCGLGVGWFAAENTALGIPFPPIAERYALLEDALEFLPLFWGKGAPAYEGRVLHVPEALCYPRPLQERVPMLVGGGGERRTLRLAAQYADACNIIGEADVVAHKLDVLRAHCEAVERDPATIEVTQLSTTLVGNDATDLHEALERLRPRRTSAEHFAARVNAGTVPDQIGRYRALAAAGVQTAIVSLPDLADATPIERFGAIIAAFR